MRHGCPTANRAARMAELRLLDERWAERRAAGRYCRMRALEPTLAWHTAHRSVPLCILSHAHASMPNKQLSSIRELAQPLHECLQAHYPELSEEARIAFGVQIVLAHQRGVGASRVLHHLGGSSSPN